MLNPYAKRRARKTCGSLIPLIQPQLDIILLVCYWYFDSWSRAKVQYISMNTVEGLFEQQPQDTIDKDNLGSSIKSLKSS